MVYGRNVGSCMDCGISVYRELMLDNYPNRILSPKGLLVMTYNMVLCDYHPIAVSMYPCGRL